jgi:hypothetical protein
MKAFNLRANETGLSVYMLPSVEPVVVSRTVVAHALASHVAPLGYRVLGTEADLCFVRGKIKKAKGATADSVVNDWHYVVESPTEREVREIAFAFCKLGEGEQWNLTRLSEEIVACHVQGFFDLTLLAPHTLERVKTILRDGGCDVS